MKKTKVCPNCGEEHSNSNSEYCNKIKTANCPNCGKKFEFKCNKRLKKYCSRECGTKHKRNKCLTCGEPAKEKYCGKEITIICKICGKEHQTKCGKTIATYCSGQCAMKDELIQEKVKNTQLEKYGSFGFNTDKQRETMIKRYGYITPAKNEKVKIKARKTQLRNHDGVLAFNTDKQKETMMNKYGSLGRLGNSKELEKQHKLMLNKYGVRTPSEHPEFLKKAMNTLIKNHGQIFNNSTISKINKDFAEKLIEELNVEVDFEYLVPNSGSFFDLHLPENNIAIELNPTITHNSTKSFACLRCKCETFPCDKHEPPNSNYHFQRAKLAKDNDIRLIQIYDWDNENEIMKLLSNKIKPISKKYSARQLTLTKITQKEANGFLNKHHIQDGSKKQTHCYGLFNNEELLAVATFSKARFKSKYEWEFMRYAVKDEVIIHGGAGKLIKEFVKEVDPVNIVSYVDFNHTTAPVTFLNTIGFKEIGETGPRLVFHRELDNKVVPMTSLLMIGADRILGTSYGRPEECGMNNEEIMIKEGFLKVYTAGNRVFIWNK